MGVAPSAATACRAGAIRRVDCWCRRSRLTDGLRVQGHRRDPRRVVDGVDLARIGLDQSGLARGKSRAQRGRHGRRELVVLAGSESATQREREPVVAEKGGVSSGRLERIQRVAVPSGAVELSLTRRAQRDQRSIHSRLVLRTVLAIGHGELTESERRHHVRAKEPLPVEALAPRREAPLVQVRLDPSGNALGQGARGIVTVDVAPRVLAPPAMRHRHRHHHEGGQQHPPPPPFPGHGEATNRGRDHARLRRLSSQPPRGAPTGGTVRWCRTSVTRSR